MTASSSRRLLALPFLLLLAACSQTSTPGTAADTASGTGTGLSTGSELLSAQATASAITLRVGQTQQINVLVGGKAPTPGQLVWTTTRAGVATVTQSGLITAVSAGSATVRAALASNRAAFIDFPVTVQATTTTPAPTPTPTTPSGDFAARVLALTNAARAQGQTCGTTAFPAVGALSYNTQLEQAAQAHAADMAAKNYFSHTSQDGRDFSARITATGYTWYTIGENIAAGQTTPEDVVAGWLRSEGHCRNIMNASFKELGVGYAANSASSYRTYWVQDFGAR